MIAQVKEQAESVVEHDVKVTLLAERWDPRDAGSDVVNHRRPSAAAMSDASRDVRPTSHRP